MYLVSRLWCPTAVDDAGSAVEGSVGLCNAKCGYCAGSPVSRDSSSKPCGYNCLINPYKVMEPLNPTEMDPALLTPPTVTENSNDPLASSNKLGYNQFKFNIGQPGVFLSCANGFNHFPCYQDIFVNCTGSYVFNAYSAEAATSSIKKKIETCNKSLTSSTPRKILFMVSKKMFKNRVDGISIRNFFDRN